jgi:hypothetical protein
MAPGDVVGWQGRDWVLADMTDDAVQLRTDDDPDGESAWAPVDAVELRWHPSGGWVADNPWIWRA